jgi:hypothetical protein
MIGFLQEENSRLKRQVRDLQEKNVKLRFENGRELLLAWAGVPRGTTHTFMGFTMDEVCTIVSNYARDNPER